MESFGKIQFIIMLIMGLACFFLGMNEEAILGTSTPIILFSLLGVVIGIIIFVNSVKSNGRNLYKPIGILLIILGIIGALVVLVNVGDDAKLYPIYARKNQLSSQLFVIFAIVEVIMGIINISLSSTQISTCKNDNDKLNIDITEQLKKLAKLKEEGILTENEFENKKKELLDRI